MSKNANLLTKREAQTADVLIAPDGGRVYQFDRTDEVTGEKYVCTLDQKRFEKYCENHYYEYRIERRADGKEYALFAPKQTFDYPQLPF